MTCYRKTKILEQIGLWWPHNYMKGDTRTARLGRKAKVFSRVAPSGDHGHARACAEPAPIVSE